MNFSSFCPSCTRAHTTRAAATPRDARFNPDRMASITPSGYVVAQLKYDLAARCKPLLSLAFKRSCNTASTVSRTKSRSSLDSTETPAPGASSPNNTCSIVRRMLPIASSESLSKSASADITLAVGQFKRTVCLTRSLPCAVNHSKASSSLGAGNNSDWQRERIVAGKSPGR